MLSQIIVLEKERRAADFAATISKDDLETEAYQMLECDRARDVMSQMEYLFDRLTAAIREGL